MNYDKLSRSLRYYYEKGIMQKVAGTYVFFYSNMWIMLTTFAYGGRYSTVGTCCWSPKVICSRMLRLHMYIFLKMTRCFEDFALLRATGPFSVPPRKVKGIFPPKARVF